MILFKYSIFILGIYIYILRIYILLRYDFIIASNPFFLYMKYFSYNHMDAFYFSIS